MGTVRIVAKQRAQKPTRYVVALRKVPVQLAFWGPKETRAPLLNTPLHTANGVKLAPLLVHTSKRTVGMAVCSSFLHSVCAGCLEP